MYIATISIRSLIPCDTIFNFSNTFVSSTSIICRIISKNSQTRGGIKVNLTTIFYSDNQVSFDYKDKKVC